MTVFRRGAARWLLVWAALFGLYAATIDADALRGSDYAGDEPHFLLAAESITADGDVDLTDEYADRSYTAWYPFALEPDGVPTAGRIHEPQGVGFPLVIAPAYALGGPALVELFLAAVAALGFVLAALLARRVVAEPWATAGAVLVGASPVAVAYGATVSPELLAGALLCGAALLALRVRENLRAVDALASATLLAVLPWLGSEYLVPAAPILVALVRWSLRRRRGIVGLLCAEIVIGSLVAYVSVNRALYGGFTPDAALGPGKTATGADSVLGHLERVPRLVAMWLDRDDGLLRWAPLLALAFLGVWLLLRSRRDGLSRVIPERVDVEAAAALALAVCAGQILVAAFAVPSLSGDWFPGRHLAAALPCAAALCAWGLRHAPRTGRALAALTLLATAWLLGALFAGTEDGWVTPSTPAPWGPLERVFPIFGEGSAWAAVVSAAAVAGLAFLAWREWRSWRALTAR